MKIVTIVGARPQFVKAAPVSKELRKEHQEILVHTGQHYNDNMSKIFFDELEIPRPDVNLGVGSNSHGKQTADMMIGIEKVLIDETPELVLVYGDTNSTLAGAITAAKLNLKVAHVEAGLRSFNRTMPEEINRILTDKVADLLFCPTEAAVVNLAHEGIEQGIHNTGDVMYDAALQFKALAEKKSDVLTRLSLAPKEYLLMTLHRAQNTDHRDNLKSILKAIVDSGQKVVFPMHPRTEKYIKLHGLEELVKSSDHFIIIEPVSYLDMIMLEQNAAKILTDSGGVQKEAYFYRVPCITLRGETEWVETVQDGWNTLVNADYDKITQAIETFLPDSVQGMHYGAGHAAGEIRTLINQYWA